MIASPYRSSFFAPMPEICARSSSDLGLCDAMPASVLSWKITNAGTDCDYASTKRHDLSLSINAASAGDSPPLAPRRTLADLPLRVGVTRRIST